MDGEKTGWRKNKWKEGIYDMRADNEGINYNRIKDENIFDRKIKKMLEKVKPIIIWGNKW